MDPAAEWEIEEHEGIPGNRRTDRRYKLRLELRWRLIHRRKVQDSGYGHTVDLSSGGILFEAVREMPVGLNVELSIAWPVLLHKVAPMQLVVSGRVVRSAGERIALRITQHEFRTMAAVPENREAGLNTARNPNHFSHGGISNFNRGR